MENSNHNTPHDESTSKETTSNNPQQMASSHKKETTAKALEVIGLGICFVLAQSFSSEGHIWTAHWCYFLTVSCLILLLATLLFHIAPRIVKGAAFVLLLLLLVVFIALLPPKHEAPEVPADAAKQTPIWQPPELPPGCNDISIYACCGGGAGGSVTGELRYIDAIVGYVTNKRFYVDVLIPKWPPFPFGCVKVSGITFLGTNSGRPWDRNYSPNEIEIVDHETNPVCQIIYTQPNAVTVCGEFTDGKTFWTFSPEGGAKLYSDMIAPASLHIGRHFKYPSYRYLGQYAEQPIKTQSTPAPEGKTVTWQPPELPPGCDQIFIYAGGGGSAGGSVTQKEFRYCDALVGHVIDNRIYVDVLIPGWPPYPRVVKVSGNTYVAAHPGLPWDMNYSSDAIEVVDNRNNPICQIIYRKPNVLVVYGVFTDGTNYWMFAPDRQEEHTTSAPFDLMTGMVDPSKFHLTRIFKYPSFRHRGEFDE